MSRAVIYLRVSTDEQSASGLGLEAQLSACKEAASRLGLPVGSVHQDDVSGGLPLEKRPGLLGAIVALEPGDALLVAKLDRLSRADPITSGMIEAAVVRRKARVISAAGEGTESDDASSVLMRRIVQAFAEYERALIKMRTRMALAAKRARGQRVGQLPFGQRLAGDGRTLEPDQSEASALGIIRDLKRSGLSLRAIGRELDARGIPAKNGAPRWAHSSIRALLKRTTTDA